MRKYLLFSLAVIGFSFGVFMIFFTSIRPKKAPITFPPPAPPYMHYVAGVGIIEASSENIEIGTPFPEVVTELYVESGSKVKKDDPLFRLNTQTLKAEYEDVIKQMLVALKNYEDQRVQFSFYERLQDKRATSESDLQKQYFAMQEAKTQVEQLEAKANIIKTNIDRSVIRAPIDGEVLDLNLRVGENAQLNPFQKPWLMLFGNLDVLHIRVDIDETDAWRVYVKAPATAYVRGNSSIKIPLEFVKIEPYVTPKLSLTGDNKERVDTRVLQVIYQLKKNKLPLYVGQLLDVYLEALPSRMQFYEDQTMLR